ncbi:hypothetical protein CH251_04990 [Rhodococcus sp. 06-462-5]|uniref:hypothetical protein n=1 Tax=unclassified Rhodococcus (in: high G+C Gram-positive bacteria) TaxID=192944 RepID=UPI000B9ADB65|nr:MULTISPECIES: hypothetical protein [unclassified Rhodococcus (in: high G+C Gram-positive bacteria)]OZC78013.1 hypothetical protein CH251_04990 [Rhodococcus sp. 06-462-5]OZE61865.1 hypothetical protein CH270_19380 [Rhodococcus sp. 02-925g]
MCCSKSSRQICLLRDSGRPGKKASDEENGLVVEAARGIDSAHGVVGEKGRRYEPLSGIVDRH